MLIEENNKSLRFNVIGYQFPDLHSTKNDYNYDANWLTCEINYSDRENNNTYRDSCLLTCELEELIEALSKILNGEPGGYISEFMEPYLQISISKADDKIMFVIHFVYDTSKNGWKKCKVSSLVEQDKALCFLEELKGLQKCYPER